jgi:hypothetical protein
LWQSNGYIRTLTFYHFEIGLTKSGNTVLKLYRMNPDIRY